MARSQVPSALAGTVAGCVLAVSLTGCRTFTRPEENPLVVQAAGPVRALATTPDRRLVLFHDATGAMLTDSPPDVFEEATRRLETLLRSRLNDAQDAQDERALEGARTTAQLSPRSQGLLLFREGSYRLTEACLNDQLDCEDYAARFDDLLERCVQLIQLQLLTDPGLTGSASTRPSPE